MRQSLAAHRLRNTGFRELKIEIVLRVENVNILLQNKLSKTILFYEFNFSIE